MEQQLLANFQQMLDQTPKDNSNAVPRSSGRPLPVHQVTNPLDHISRDSFTVARSLIINPSTSENTLSSLLETLTLSLQKPDANPLSTHHTLCLLSDLSLRRPDFSHLIFTAVTAFSLLPTTQTRSIADSLSLLLSVCERDPSLVPSFANISESLFLSLCFRPCISIRYWLLQNAGKFHVRPSVLLTILLGFTKDPYPYIRRAALDGLSDLCHSIVVEDRSLVEGCYFRGVELLFDTEDCVRCSAVRVVSVWGKLLVSSTEENKRIDTSDALFVQLCVMVRDMNMKVRVEAFDALGKVELVSEDILLQTLKKKALQTLKDKNYPGKFMANGSEIPASSASRAFIHGLEDEFYEVRRSACHSLLMLSTLSAEFSVESLNFMIDVLNDDSMDVRIQALQTIHHMATFHHLIIEETYMPMFLFTLLDGSPVIRSAVREILGLIKLQTFDMFKLCVDALLQNLDMYKQDEADIFWVLFNIGRRHGNFAVSMIQENSKEIEPSFEGKLTLDNTKTAAFLVLAISAPVSPEYKICSIPPIIFSYAVTLLGRISRGLVNVIDQNTLLAYLTRCSRSEVVSAAEFFKPVSQVTENEDANVAMIILASVKDIWPLIRFGCTEEVLRTLRSWKQELETFTDNSLQHKAELFFTLQYLGIIKLLGKAWANIMSPRKQWPTQTETSIAILTRLDEKLREIRIRFLGLSKEVESHVLELILVTRCLRLSTSKPIFDDGSLKKLHSMVSHVESIEPSDFVIELAKSLREINTSNDWDSYNPCFFKKSLECFSLKQLCLISGKLKYVNVEIDVEGMDFVKPLPFIHGLPVGIPCRITLYNVGDDTRLWLKMTVDDEKLNQFVFIDSSQFGGGDDELMKFDFVAPFYRTPKVDSFTIRVCVGVECLFEERYALKGSRGPKHELAYLCKEKEVHLSQVVK